MEMICRVWKTLACSYFIDFISFLQLPLVSQKKRFSKNACMFFRHQFFRNIIIKFRANTNDNEKNEVIQLLEEYTVSQWDYRTSASKINTVSEIMALIFNNSAYVVLFLCLFSLMASMYVNILEQTKEIAILKSLGFTTWQICRVYAYEALILVLSSAILGIGVGATVGFTMGAQMALYNDYPIYIEIPWQLLLNVVIVSFVSAVLSVVLPLLDLSRKPISQIMRITI
ncbi:FtsX domain-containing protein [Reticulomyxa filosa]|uniref:FtsX domain-containing protein n=1 Tax=Reticulomyxa filosa TaxID=46433 RepID=X6P983_RETFI|nr:FtsX domain-containing protein [Reticulomyxa filosa]|eukprot:ETO34673.1 FtsX domain-containing protein [Reticulomyxa filosa]